MQKPPNASTLRTVNIRENMAMMMRPMSRNALCALCLSVVAMAAHAYDAETHALIAYDAYKASVLAQTGSTYGCALGP